MSPEKGPDSCSRGMTTLTDMFVSGTDCDETTLPVCE